MRIDVQLVSQGVAELNQLRCGLNVVAGINCGESFGEIG
jgi:hypothetical protein